MKKVIVIGVGGVGMAHVIAAARVGYAVTAIIDRDPATLERAREDWSNTFDGQTERTEPQAGCEYFTRLPDYPPPPADIVIVATPPHMQEQLLPRVSDLWPSALLLVEKPMWLSAPTLRAVGTRLRLSAEWTHLIGLDALLRDCTEIKILSGDRTTTTDWGYQLSMLSDWGPHLASMFATQLPATNNFGWEWLESGLNEFCGFLRYGEKRVVVTAARDAHLPYAWEFNGQIRRWQPDLFDLQLLNKPYGLAGGRISVVNEISTGRKFDG